jgi:Cell Wall Hydrolase
MATRELTAQHFDLADEEKAPRRWRAEHWLIGAILAMAAALALSFALPMLTQAMVAPAQTNPQVGNTVADVGPIDAISVDDKSQIVVSGTDAEARNAAIPLLGLPLDKVQAFGIAAAKSETYQNALKCLTQAVYYEAAVEPLEGRRAVAQVVLNRVLHPAYPKSVCGVVYQGAERHTGCQFSFTCDGALLRSPAAGPWREAQAVALAALSGYVEPSVGTATFYHADYVLPNWAYRLGKINKIGRHIFYRFNGSMGNAATFNGRYSGIERIPALDFAALRARATEDGTIEEVPAELFAPGLTVPPEVTDRHAENDVGGRIDMTKTWRPSIPDPVSSGNRLQAVVAGSHQPLAAAEATPAAKIATSQQSAGSAQQ